MRILAFFVVLSSFCFANPSLDQRKLQTLYSSLDPTSISKLFAFYELYPDTSYGKEALQRVWDLIYLHKEEEEAKKPTEIKLPDLDIGAMIALVNRQPYEKKVELSKKQLDQIEELSSHLCNRKLKGYKVTNKEELTSLGNHEIDLARALLLYQYESAEDPLYEVRKYEANLDLMALQILARLQKGATHLEKVHAINDFIFHEMGYRFPPHSLWAKDIDVYTFLPSVIDSRKGVCLGVSILYLSLAQRIDVPLEIITPPGHIYVRFRNNDEIINIETTARGVNTPSEMYLGINTKKLYQRELKEVVGLAFVNQASVMLHRKDYDTAIKLYEMAMPYTPDDDLLKMLLGMAYLMRHDFEKAEPLFKQIAGKTFVDAVHPETIPVDYLSGNATVDAIEAIFLPVDETRESILEKQKILISVLEECPGFRAGNLQLAVTWLQLGRGKEALEALQKCYDLDPKDPTLNYYLSILSLQRLSYQRSWDYLTNTKEILISNEHNPKMLRSLEFQLRQVYPDPIHKICN